MPDSVQGCEGRIGADFTSEILLCFISECDTEEMRRLIIPYWREKVYAKSWREGSAISRCLGVVWGGMHREG